eukprot:Nk52_evm32s1524 gene=Nk52_evmTU32s1524
MLLVLLRTLEQPWFKVNIVESDGTIHQLRSRFVKHFTSTDDKTKLILKAVDFLLDVKENIQMYGDRKVRELTRAGLDLRNSVYKTQLLESLPTFFRTMVKGQLKLKTDEELEQLSITDLTEMAVELDPNEGSIRKSDRKQKSPSRSPSIDHGDRICEIDTVEDTDKVVWAKTVKPIAPKPPTINEQLPNDGYCPLPEAVVRLDTPEGKLVYQEQYKNHPRFLKSKDTELQKLADNGTIARSNPNCRWNSAIHTVFKKHRSELTAADFKEAETRPCIDVRLLNLMLLCTLFTLTNANTMIAACSGFAIFSLIDLTRGFHHMPILPEHAEKLSFTWKGERWHYKRAPFGLNHVPGLFSRLINKVLQGIPNGMAYLDDIVVFTNTVEEHIG